MASITNELHCRDDCACAIANGDTSGLDYYGPEYRAAKQMEWKSDGYATVSGDPRGEGQYRISRQSDGSECQVHKTKLSGYGDNAKRTTELVGNFTSMDAAKQAASDHANGAKN